MRARNLKPSLFRNELLAVSNPLFTVVFQGLWCIADRAGRLEDRPAKIHLEINPGRAFDSTTAALDWLAENGFILRYEADGAKFIQVVNFAKHQNPHCKEPESTIPAPCKPGASTVPARLIPDSGLLIPDPPKRSEAPFAPSVVSGLDVAAWNRWVGYRKQIGKPLKPASLPAAAKQMVALGEGQAAAVQHSIANSYQGLFPPSANGQAKAAKSDPYRNAL